MKRDYRKMYNCERSYPDTYIAAKLYITASKLLNKILACEDVHEDVFNTLIFYSNLAKHRACVSDEEINKTHKNREDMYNKIYKCKEHLNESDVASFLVAKALRMKNVLLECREWHKDSLIDFIVYLNILCVNFFKLSYIYANEELQGGEK